MPSYAANKEVTVAQSADVSIAKSDSKDPVNPGEAFTYTLTVSNTGPCSAPVRPAATTVPWQLTVTGETPSAGSCSASSGNSVDCTRASLAKNGPWTIT